MRLASIGHFYHWSRAELERLTATEAAFWHGAATQFLEEVKKAAEAAEAEG